MPPISVIIPTRQRNHLLPRALGSLLAQTFTDFEIILVDDNPEESRVSKQPALGPLLKDSRIRLVENRNPKNAARARNVGLRIAQGEWVTYLDDDDAYLPTKLQKQWQRANETGLPIGLCGLVYKTLGRRILRQISAPQFSGTELLLDAIAGTVAIFHRFTQEVSFDENLYAGEDAYFFHCLVRHFGIRAVFNVPEPLIEVYPQPGKRVNTNAEGLWEANQAIYREFAPAYGAAAAEIFLHRARLGYLKFQRGRWGDMLYVALCLLRFRGVKELRPILNAFCLKLPGARRWLVS